MRSDHWALKKLWEQTGNDREFKKIVDETPFFEIGTDEYIGEIPNWEDVVNAFPFNRFIISNKAINKNTGKVVEVWCYLQQVLNGGDMADYIKNTYVDLFDKKNTKMESKDLTDLSILGMVTIKTPEITQGLPIIRFLTQSFHQKESGAIPIVFRTDDFNYWKQYGYTDENKNLIGSAITGNINDAIMQISFSNKHLVTESVKQYNLKSKPNGSKKPWVKDYDKIILIDNNSPIYPRVDNGGSHASPIPHNRRGHFAELRSERFKYKRGQKVWVKPAWVGPEIWENNGKIYKVIKQEKPCKSTT